MMFRDTITSHIIVIQFRAGIFMCSRLINKSFFPDWALCLFLYLAGKFQDQIVTWLWKVCVYTWK